MEHLRSRVGPAPSRAESTLCFFPISFYIISSIDGAFRLDPFDHPLPMCPSSIPCLPALLGHLAQPLSHFLFRKNTLHISVSGSRPFTFIRELDKRHHVQVILQSVLQRLSGILNLMALWGEWVPDSLRPNTEFLGSRQHFPEPGG